MSKHYETLGVPPEASPEEIKQAFRRAAAKAHPDKDGGSDEQMALVNKAYEVLCDAERRKRYDETGDDGQLPSVEKEALHTVVEWFRQALDQDGNIVQFARRQLAAARNGARAQASESNKKADRLRRRRARIKVKAGSNLVHGIIDSQVADLMQLVEQCKRVQEVADAAEKLIELYESDEPDEQEPDLAAAMRMLMSEGFRARTGPGGSRGRY
jgi:curved DNA-binding protein CbpA